MILPPQFDRSKKYPMLIQVYVMFSSVYKLFTGNMLGEIHVYEIERTILLGNSSYWCCFYIFPQLIQVNKIWLFKIDRGSFEIWDGLACICCVEFPWDGKLPNVSEYLWDREIAAKKNSVNHLNILCNWVRNEIKEWNTFSGITPKISADLHTICLKHHAFF